MVRSKPNRPQSLVLFSRSHSFESSLADPMAVPDRRVVVQGAGQRIGQEIEAMPVHKAERNMSATRTLAGNGDPGDRRG